MAKRKNDSPEKAAMREMMQSYLKENGVSIKSGEDVNSIMRNMMSVLLEGVLDEELDEELGKMAASYGMELDKLKETLNEETKDQIRKDVAVQKAVTLVAEAAKEI